MEQQDSNAEEGESGDEDYNLNCLVIVLGMGGGGEEGGRSLDGCGRITTRTKLCFA